MSKVLLADIVGEAGIRGLMADGKLLKFQFNGVCIGEFDITYGVASMQEVDIISLLVTPKAVEVGFHINQEFTKKPAVRGIADIAAIMNTLNGLVFVGRRDGHLDGVSFSQYIYAFIKGSVSSSIML